MKPAHAKIGLSATGSPRRLPPLNMLRAFEAAARLLSVTQAAHELSVTQSAVSELIKGGEGWVGVGVVEREGGGLALSEPVSY